MIVIDASAILELLLQTPRAAALEQLLLGANVSLHAPHLLDVECAQALRRLQLGQQLTRHRADLALEDYSGLVIERHDHAELVKRAWMLKGAMTVYDGVYVALAEALAAPLVTCDGKLARSHGHRADIRLV